MTAWNQQSEEERALLNPSFCSCLIWQAAQSYRTALGTAFPLYLGFLILPIVLHTETRDALPRSVATSLAVWLAEKPLSRGKIADHAKSLTAFTKEALLFGSTRGLLKLIDGGIEGSDAFKRSIGKYISDSSSEIQTCMTKATFVGRWFAKAGTQNAVMATFGLRP